MIIAVGTTNDAKLRSVLVAIELIMKHKPTFCTDPIIKGIKCNSNVSEQPLSEEETQQGAINRAKEALRMCTEATFGIMRLNKELESKAVFPRLVNDGSNRDGFVLLIDRETLGWAVVIVMKYGNLFLNGSIMEWNYQRRLRV